MSSNESLKGTSALFASSVNAKAFVPTAAAPSTPTATPPSSSLVVGGIVSSELVKAAPFVPQSAQASTAGKPASGKNVNSAPFVPRGHGGGNRRPAPTPHSPGNDDAASTSQQHGSGRGGYGGRILSPMKHGGRGGVASGSVPPPPYQAGRGAGRSSSDGGSSGGMPSGNYGGRGRGRNPYSVPGGMSGPHSGAQAHGYASLMPMSTSGPSSLPAQRHHEPYMMGHGRAALQLRFMNDAIRQQLQQQSYLVQSQWSYETSGGSAEDFVPLPDKVHQYHTLHPLEDPTGYGNDKMSGALGLRTFVFKGINCVDGQAYALRRVCGKQVIPSADLLSQAKSAVEAWTPVSNHPNIAGLRAAFVSSEMDGGSALFFVHDYHPGSMTLAQVHLIPTTSSSGVVSLSSASEAQLWSYLVQLTSALRCVHSAGLALRPSCLHPSKVLVNSLGQIRIGSVGIQDALNPGDLHDQDEPHHVHRLDLTAIGQLLLALACAGISPTPSLDVCAAHYSMELTRIIAALLASSEGGQLASWRQLAIAMADRTMAELDNANVLGNSLMHELSKECENGRLLRLMVKLGFVNERPEVDGDTQWAETGDRYLLKLFRDFVFHQVREDGTPITDWGHVTEALNKLDAGVPEKILLMSRDEQSMLVVSYADLKRCVEGTYADLQHVKPRGVQLAPPDT